MSLVSVRSALEKQLETVEADFPTAYENVEFDPVVGEPWQECFLMPAEPDNPTICGDHYREQGIFQVNLHYPVKEGTGDAMTKAESIKTAFARGTSMTEGGITVRVERTPEIIQGRVDEQNWWIVTIRIRWFADVF